MKSVDEIMKGLESHTVKHKCVGCPYKAMQERNGLCVDSLLEDALALIQRLDKTVVETEKLAKTLHDQKDALESKLNQAVEDIRMLGGIGNWLCPVCAHYNHGEGTKGKCVKCLTGDGFRWRGEKEEDK